jgi:hypothetical protein
MLLSFSALKRNLVAQFEVTKETGPPHMRKFITRCRCGDFITDGEGNGKKVRTLFNMGNGLAMILTIKKEI